MAAAQANPAHVINTPTLDSEADLETCTIEELERKVQDAMNSKKAFAKHSITADHQIHRVNKVIIRKLQTENRWKSLAIAADRLLRERKQKETEIINRLHETTVVEDVRLPPMTFYLPIPGV